MDSTSMQGDECDCLVNAIHRNELSEAFHLKVNRQERKPTDCIRLAVDNMTVRNRLSVTD